MSESIKTDTYSTLANDIAELYSRTRKTLVPKAGYGVRLLEHLSVDLSKKLGGGFSVRNLYRMRDFYLVHKILPAAAKLSWSQHVELLPLTNKTDKRRLEKRVIREKKGPYVLT